MKCEYIGKTEEHNCREAYITYDERKEQAKFDQIYEVLTQKGWQLECEEECACIEVSDKAEYDAFYADYKEVKIKLKSKE